MHNKWSAKYEHVIAVAGAPDSPPAGTPTFEVEIKSALEVTLELHLKVHMVVGFLEQKSIQNDSIKLDEALYVALEGAPNI